MGEMYQKSWVKFLGCAALVAAVPIVTALSRAEGPAASVLRFSIEVAPMVSSCAPTDYGCSSELLRYIRVKDQSGSSIFPDDRELMDAFKGNGDISTHVEGSRYLPRSSTDNTLDRFAFRSRGYPQAVPVRVVLSNVSELPVTVTTAELSVAESVTDLQPFFLQSGNEDLATPGGIPCALSFFPETRDFSRITFENYGWGRTSESRIEFSFSNIRWEGHSSIDLQRVWASPTPNVHLTPSTTASEPIQDAHGNLTYNVHDALYALGVDRVGLEHRLTRFKEYDDRYWMPAPFPLSGYYSGEDDPNYISDVKRFRAQSGQDGLGCPFPMSDEDCLRRQRASGQYGALATALWIDQYGVLGTTMTGRLTYVWHDGKGRAHTHAGRFATLVALGARWVGASGQCTAGDSAEAPDYNPSSPIIATLALDRSNYKLSLPVRTVINPGQSAKVSLLLRFGKSSQHKFKVVANQANGASIASDDVRLQTFVPVFDWKGPTYKD